MIQRKTVIDVTLSPSELAFEFANMDNEQQAMFFNELFNIVEKWDRPFCFQLQSLIDSKSLTREGRYIMESIGQYGSQDEDRCCHDCGESDSVTILDPTHRKRVWP
jgi:hypothetical protein